MIQAGDILFNEFSRKLTVAIKLGLLKDYVLMDFEEVVQFL